MNDERPIEKLLRRYAKKRRDDAGAPVELHPATRRILQGEVARRFPKRAAAGDGAATTFAQVLKSWRATLIWALPVLIVLGVGVWALVGTKEEPGHEFDLAKNTSAPTGPTGMVARSFKALETPAPASPAPATSLGDQATLAYANSIPARDGLESSGVPVESREDRLGVALKGGTIRLKQGDARTAHDLAALSENETGLKLETRSPAANDFGQISPGDQLRNQTAVAKRPLVEDFSGFYDEKAQTKSLALAAPAKSDSLESFESIRKNYVAVSAGKRASAPARPPAVLAPESASARYFRPEARGGGEREKVQAYSQAFVNRAPAPAYGKMARAPGITPVLVNFQVEQAGNQLRVIDADGSTYLGEMNLASTGQIPTVAFKNKDAEKSNLENEGQRATGRLGVTQLPEQQSVQNFECRVSGTNRTLNQQVVFTWNFVPLTNELAAAQVKLPAADARGAQNNLPAQSRTLSGLLNNSVINGRAQFDNAKEIEINAVPVSP